MASPQQNFTLNLKTTGDPSGAQVVEQALFRVNEATETLTLNSGGTSQLEHSMERTAQSAALADDKVETLATAIARLGQVIDQNNAVLAEMSAHLKGLGESGARSMERTAQSVTAADVAIEKLEHAVEQLNEEIARNDSLTDEQVANMRKVVNGGEQIIRVTRQQRAATDAAHKSTANFGLGALAVSQAFEDMQYGIRGVLNNIPQMIMMFGGSAGLTAVISIAAVSATVLYGKLTSGASAAKESQDELNDAIEDTKRYYEELTALDLKDLEAARKRNEDRVSFAKEEVSLAEKAAGFRDSMEALKLRREAELAIARERLELAKEEARIIVEGGETADRLLQVREESHRRILAIEQQTTEQIRQQEILALRRKAEGAREVQEAADIGRGRANETVNAYAAKQDELMQALADSMDLRLKKVADLDAEFETLTAQLAQERANRTEYKESGVRIRFLEERLAQIPFDRESALDRPESEQALDAQIASNQKSLETARANLEQATEAWTTAAKAVEEASRQLNEAATRQQADREFEQRKQEVDRQQREFRPPDQSPAINALSLLSESLGETELAPIAAQFKQIAEDQSLSVDELSKAQLLLQQYFNAIANLGAAQNAQVRDAMARIDQLDREVRSLRSNQRHPNP